MHNLGIHGHMRRIYDPNQYEFLQPLQPMNTFISWMVYGLVASQLLFVINYFWSMWKGPKAEANAWNSNTLEWTAAPAVPPHGNFPGGTPTVYRGPYDYSHPGSDEDFLPQNAPPGPERLEPAPGTVSVSPPSGASTHETEETP
jgi:cytochrome c oxidase subunit 1